MDRQVKLRGHRIELGEIDAAIRAVTNGAAVSTVMVDGTIVSFVETSRLDIEQVRRKIGERLPDYMIPREIRLIDGLLRSANDKIDGNTPIFRGFQK